MSYKESIKKLLEGIKEDYAGWGSSPNDLDESSKKIKLKMIDEFNNGLMLSQVRSMIRSSLKVLFGVSSLKKMVY